MKIKKIISVLLVFLIAFQIQVFADPIIVKKEDNADDQEYEYVITDWVQSSEEKENYVLHQPVVIANVLPRIDRK